MTEQERKDLIDSISTRIDVFLSKLKDTLKYKRNNREEYDKKYRELNKDKISKYGKEYRDLNKKEILVRDRIRSKEYHKIHKYEISEKKRENKDIK